MEALHEAYRQISLPAEGSGDPLLPAPPGGRGRTSSPGSPPATTTTSPPGPGASRGSLRAASTSGSGGRVCRSPLAHSLSELYMIVGLN